MFKGRYLNPFTDFGFKKLFGEAPNKALLKDFLSELLRSEQGNIKKLTYLTHEHLGRSKDDRRAIFDLYCENEQGEKFIVEIQKCKQKFFKERSVFYATFPIQEQAPKGDWDYNLKAVYTIAILDFDFDEDKNSPDQYIYNVKLSNIETHQVFYDKLTFIYLTMPKFKKTEAELVTHFDKWLYVIRHLQDLTKRPAKLQEKVFQQLFKTAEIAAFTKDERIEYEDSLKKYRDIKNSLDTAFDDGKTKGRAEGRMEGEAIGLEKGEAIGLEKGEAIGLEKGEAIGVEKRNRDLCLQLQKGGKSIAEIAHILNLATKTVEEYLE